MVPSVVLVLRIADGVAFAALAGFLVWLAVKLRHAPRTFKKPEGFWTQAFIFLWGGAAAATLAVVACLTGQEAWWFAAAGLLVLIVFGFDRASKWIVARRKRLRAQGTSAADPGETAIPNNAGKDGLSEGAED